MAKKVNIKQANGKTARISTVAGKDVEIKDDQSGFKEGDVVRAFNLSDTVQFKVAHGKDVAANKQHVPNGTVITLHELDAQILAAAGRGKIVTGKDAEQVEEKEADNTGE